MPSIPICFTATPSSFTDIGFREIIALEEERRSVGLGAGVCEAITHIQCRRMLSLSEFGVGFGGQVELSLTEATASR